MNIAVTGSSGFFGSHLLPSLKKRNFHVTSFDRKKNNLFHSKTLKDFLKDKDIVIHLAGVDKGGSIENMLRVNILGTKKLLDAMSIYCPNVKFIFASSFRLYEKNDVLGLSKLIGEELIKDYIDSKLIKSAIIFRFSNLYGPGGKPFRNSVVATFTYLIKSGKAITIDGNGEQTRDFLYVDDAIDAIIRGIEFNLKKGIEIFDICSGKLTSIEEIAEILLKLSDKKILIKYTGSSQYLEELIKDFIKAKKLLGWNPHTSLEDGLKKVTR